MRRERLATTLRGLEHGWTKKDRRATLLRLSRRTLRGPTALFGVISEDKDRYFPDPTLPADHFGSRLGLAEIHALFLSLFDPRFLEPL